MSSHSHPTLPSTLEGRMRMELLLLYSSVEEESRASVSSRRTLPSTLEGRMRLLLLYTTVEVEGGVIASYPTL